MTEPNRSPAGPQPGNFISQSKLEILRYPQEVGSEKVPNWMMFYIFEREGVYSGEKAPPGAAPNVEPPSAQNRSEARTPTFVRTAILGTATAIGAYNTAKPVTNAVGDMAKTATATPLPAVNQARNAGIENLEQTGNIAAGVVGGGAGVGVALAEGSSAKDLVVMKTAIALYMNNKPKTSYSADWSDLELGVLGGAADIAASIGKIITGEGEGRMEAAQQALASAGGAAAYVALDKANQGPISDLMGNVDVAGAAQGLNRIAKNPFKMQAFKSMNFRKFNFDYTFLPRNQAELMEVRKIIFTFKRFMHPTLGSDRMFLSYPAEFQIHFHYRDEENDNLFKISNCALTDMEVEYGGQDFTVFRGTQGHPTEISMSLTFTELEILTRERIMGGKLSVDEQGNGSFTPSGGRYNF